MMMVVSEVKCTMIFSRFVDSMVLNVCVLLVINKTQIFCYLIASLSVNTPKVSSLFPVFEYLLLLNSFDNMCQKFSNNHIPFDYCKR